MKLPVNEDQFRLLLINQITIIINTLTYKDEGNSLRENINLLFDIKLFIGNLNFTNQDDILKLLEVKKTYRSSLQCLQTTMYREMLDIIVDTIIITFNNYQGKN